MKAILIEEGYWMNSQLSVARFYGGIKFNGEEYVIVPPKNDLILKEWGPVYEKLGRERTIGLIKNGTTLKVAKQMVEAAKHIEEAKQLNLMDDWYDLNLDTAMPDAVRHREKEID